MYNGKYIKAKIKIYNNGIYTNFQHNKIRKHDECCACLSVILLDSLVVNADKKFYPKIFLEECKYAVKKKKVIQLMKN